MLYVTFSPLSIFVKIYIPRPPPPDRLASRYHFYVVVVEYILSSYILYIYMMTADVLGA